MSGKTFSLDLISHKRIVSLRTNKLKNSPDGLIYKYDTSIAKKYLNEE